MSSTAVSHELGPQLHANDLPDELLGVRPPPRQANDVLRRPCADPIPPGPD